jgi:LPS-assembly protein
MPKPSFSWSPVLLVCSLCAALQSAWAQSVDAALPGLRLSHELVEDLSDVAKDQLPTFVSGDNITGEADVSTRIDGQAQLRRHGVIIKADTITQDVATDVVTMEGHVQVNQRGNRFEGPKAQIKLDTTQGYFETPDFEINSLNGQGQGRGQAQRIDFQGPDVAVATDVTYSTCPRPPGSTWAPDWLVSASTITFDQATDTGTAIGGVLKFKGVPLLASPWVSFPLSDERKSGLLPPTLNFDEASGVEFTVPYYLNIAPNHDATLYPTYMSKRGLDVAGEYRYLGTSYDGRLRAAYMADDQLRDGANRWGWSWQHNQGLRVGDLPVRLQTNLNRVSDGDYWSDFPRSTTSLTDRLLANDVVFSTQQGLWKASVGSYKWETLQSTNTTKITAPYDREPHITYELASNSPQNQLAGMDWLVNTQFTAFSGDPADHAFNGDRAVVSGNLSRRFSTAGGYITPALRVHSRSYQLDNALTRGPFVDRRSANVTLPTLSLDSGLVFERDTSSGGLQTLEPRALLAYTPYKDQDGLPNYDSGEADFNLSSIYAPNPFTGNDRVADTKTLTLGVTSRWYEAQSGRELFSLTAAQRTRLADQVQGIAYGAAVQTDRVSDVLLGGTYKPNDRWSFDGLVQYDQDIGRARRVTWTGSYSPSNYRTVSLAYRLQRDTSELIDLAWQWPLNDLWGDSGEDLGPGRGLGAPRWYTVGRVNYSQLDKKVADLVTGLEYDAGCWVGRVVLEQLQTTLTTSNKRILFQLEFVGFSRIGASPLKTLSESVPRYQYLRQDVQAPSRFQNYD